MSAQRKRDRDRERARHHACTRKVTYQSQMTATNAATALGWAGRQGLQPYHCRWCGLWHVGHAARITRRTR